MKQETIPLTYKHAILFFIAGVVGAFYFYDEIFGAVILQSLLFAVLQRLRR
jgi:hypothetical protein